MFKKITAVLAAVLLGVGISVVAVAAPASAHTPTISVDCNSIDYKFVGYGGGSTNTFKVYLDGAATPALDIVFGDSLAQTSFAFDGSTSHSVHYVLDAQANGYDKDVTVVTTPCTYPDKAVDVTCSAITATWNGALVNGVHMNVRVQIGGSEKTLAAYVDQNVGGGYNGLGLVITDVNGVTTKLPLTEQQVKSGKVTWTYPTALGGATAWAVKWVQMDTKYFNKSGSDDSANWMYCNYQTISVQTAPSFTEATCAAAGTLVVPAQDGIIWTGGTNGAGAGKYDLVATPADGYTLTGQTKWTITVPPMKSGVECAPPCIPNTAVSYTYEPETNSGNIHVENIDGSTGKLCAPFWVTATSWKFIEGDKVWSQVRDFVQQLPKIDAPGDYAYAAPVDCGQGDIYASFTESPNPPKYLHGPSNPWAEHFLHQMGFTGPNPTYTQDSPGCNIVVPATPTATVIDECGEYGSVVVPQDSAAFTYSVVGGPKEGKVTVTATVKEGYVVQEGAKTVFEFDLGTFHPCVQQCEVKAPPVLSTNLDAAGWDFSETRTTGHVDYVENGLHIWTEGNTTTDKAAGYVPLSIPLGNIGSPSIQYASTTGGKPGLQIVLDKDGNGSVDGIIAQEVGFYGDQWWSKTDFGVGAGSGYASLGTLQDYLDANPAAKVVAVGFSLGSGVLGDAVITSLSFGCNTYVFDVVIVEPKVTAEFGACYPNGDFSSKNAYFVFDNSLSDVPVTFSVPAAADVNDKSDAGTPDNAGIVVTVAAHSKSQPIETTPYWHKGGVGYDVYADGDLLEHLEFPPFEQCQDKLIPGDPTATPQTCVEGVLKAGGIWVSQLPDKLEYTITGGTLTEPLVVTSVDGYTELPPGDYLVTVKGLNGFEVDGQDKWPYKITVEKPVACDTIQIPVVPTTDITCQAGGTYTLPTVDGIEWWVDGVKKDPFTYKVFFTANVSITAKITTDGTFFPNGKTSATWVEEFVAPTTDCQLTDHPIVFPTSTSTPGSCAAAPTYTLSNTLGVQWVLTGKGNVDPGTYTGKWGESVEITATLPDPINYGFELGQQTVWDYTFAAAPKNCDLLTLALTGASTGGFVPWIAGGLLLLGGAGIYFQRRLVASRK